MVRSKGSWADLPHLAEIYADGTHRAERQSGGWSVVTVKDTSPEAHWIPTLADATGAPVLWCTITMMDATYIRGLSKAGAWEGWLNTGGVDEEVAATRLEELDLEELLDDGEQEAYDEAMQRLGSEVVDEIIGAAPALAEAMSRWAREGGYDPDVAAIQALLVEGDSFGSRHVDGLLRLLGVKDLPPSPPATAPAAQPTQR